MTCTSVPRYEESSQMWTSSSPATCSLHTQQHLTAIQNLDLWLGRLVQFNSLLAFHVGNHHTMTALKRENSFAFHCFPFSLVLLWPQLGVLKFLLSYRLSSMGGKGRQVALLSWFTHAQHILLFPVHQSHRCCIQASMAQLHPPAPSHTAPLQCWLDWVQGTMLILLPALQ